MFEDSEEIPIGKACENKEVLLLDENLREVALMRIANPDVSFTLKTTESIPLSAHFLIALMCWKG